MFFRELNEEDLEWTFLTQMVPIEQKNGIFARIFDFYFRNQATDQATDDDF